MKLLEKIKRALWGRKLVDHSHRRPAPDRRTLHLGYVLLYELAIIAALWQHGHPTFTLVLLALAPMLAVFAFIPYRIIASGVRFLLQLLIVAGAGAWLLYRLQNHVTPDKCILEMLAATGLCFVMAQAPRDYGYLLTLGTILLLYGTLLPRTIFLWCFAGGMGLLLLLSIVNRLRALSGGELAAPRRIVRRNWPFWMLYLALSGLTAYLFFQLLPTERTESRGMIEVSFSHDKESMLPPDMRRWFESEKVLAKSGGRQEVKLGTPDTLGRTGVRVSAPNQKQPPAGMSPDGSGSAPPGDQLVFRVRSEYKLYHLARLYDVYDGERWQATRAVEYIRRRDNKGSSTGKGRIETDAESIYTVLSWQSRRLPAPYRAIFLEAQMSSENLNSVWIETSVAGGLIPADQPLPAVPFQYRAVSRLGIPPDMTGDGDNETEPPNLWREGVGQRHYLALPNQKISKRLRKLVRTLVEDEPGVYERALKLRDYLRSNFKYEQFSRPTPRGREPADYFVFELKQGHCEYFASALAVMARLAGLPARVATGYSPGNYNTLNNLFEVYEYHAHAWTQIFLPEFGWVTMDATPPGAVESRTTPIGLGQLRDPFGEEWRVTPPELTPRTLETIQRAWLKKIERMQDKSPSALEKALGNAAEKQEELRARVAAAYNKAIKKIAPGAKPAPAPPRNWRERLEALKRQILDGGRIAGDGLKRYWPVLPVLLLMGASCLLFGRLWYRLRQRRRLRQRQKTLLAAAARNAADTPVQSMIDSCKALGCLLQLAGCGRRPHEELFDYADRLETSGFEGYPVARIVRDFYRALYAGDSDRRTALLTLRRVYSIRRKLARDGALK